MRNLPIDLDYLQSTLLELLNTPSPTGMTDGVVQRVCHHLDALGVEYELTRRGAIRANLPGQVHTPDRAIAAHLDTLGAMVKGLKANGRLEVAPVGTWPARSAEGARVTLYGDEGTPRFRGTLLPLKASGHVFGREVDTQESVWQKLELRLDEAVHNQQDLEALGIRCGDMLAVDPAPEFMDNGYWVSRFLDDKAGVAAVLAAVKAVVDHRLTLPMDCHLLFTISEETGAGASHILHGDVAELVAVDNGTLAPGQNTSEFGATIAMQDSTGPFDWYLTRSLTGLCEHYGVEHSRDLFRYYRSDAASALEAGNDIRTALVCFALDASHGYERTHRDSVAAVAKLLMLYMQSGPLFKRDRHAIGPLEDFAEPSGDPSRDPLEE
ncbi:osmoprotectant NAGGN system M42 family peptidase [Aestuariirhabdus litorea]|uniref:Osmoprotectant NAGGN system M42 family peptidase n=1 Tax=Aestuariirhabdus litorea TaxID=2528527 RepID=A0A3P3VJL0_9GAMM|nr:osmoprotectant NAGGN system M42 family peptidase [Aestuariirhabdus litorea]RRJ82941.1 osmoprotectant NAGGN system M42 family peptidase [Aestuariirhabdus litorea]RWW93100.1 osmoprotectant NAGGN system M42 family peptidase [Endozoicomonadaceae bacterium GTF-13]